MKILAIDKLLPEVATKDIAPHLRNEALHAWMLYKQGVFRELYFRGDRPGAVVIMECRDVDEARKIMNELPLVKSNLIEFEFIPIGYFAPFASLFEKQSVDSTNEQK